MKQTLHLSHPGRLAVSVVAGLLLQNATAQEVITLPKKVFGTGEAIIAAYSPDGILIVTGNQAGAFLWDATTGRQIRRFPGPIEEVGALAFSPDGTQIATASRQEDVNDPGFHAHLRLWNVATGASIWETQPPQDVSQNNLSPTGQVAFSPNGQMILGRSLKNEGSFVFLWSAGTGQLLHTLTGQYEILDAAFSPDSSLVVTGCSDRRVRIWDAATGQELLVLQGHSHPVDTVVFSPDGTKVLTGSGGDSTARLWDASSGALLQTLWNDYWGELCPDSMPVLFTPDGTKVLTGGLHSRLVVVRLWDLETGEIEREWEYGTGFDYIPQYVSLCISHDGSKALIAAGLAGSMSDTDWTLDTVELLDLDNGQPIMDIPFEHGVSAILSPDDSTFVALGDCHARLWSCTSGEMIADLGGRPFVALALAPDGKTLATATQGIDVAPTSTVMIWDLNSGLEERRFAWPNHEVRRLDFSPDGSRLLATGETSAQWGYSASIWDHASGELLLQLGHPDDYIKRGAFSPDGQEVLLGGLSDSPHYRFELSLWDASSGTMLKTFPLPPVTTSWLRSLLDVNFSPDGDRVVCAMDFEGVMMWDVATGSLIRHFPILEGERVFTARFSPDGQHVLCTADNSTDVPDRTLLWDTETGQVTMSILSHGWLYVRSLFSPDGQWIVVVGWDQDQVVDATTGELLYVIQSGRIPGWSIPEAFSPDGRNFFTVGNGAVAMWELVPAPELTIAKGAEGHLVLTWQNPSSGSPFTLQQCGDLSVGDWADVTVTTPGRHEITAPAGTMFYRLREP
jgi:WD40 repeat protein